MSLSHFHPVLQRWFSETLGEPTAAQTRGWAAIRERRHTLIAAPTGSGKTLAAFLNALDDLFVEGLHAPLPDEVRVVYVSPLKALSADIHKNLAEPRSGIRRIAADMGLDAPRITAAVRTGDTTSSERASMLRTPPHILVTTPESLYLLLTAERSRAMLRTARTVIVDEIHAVIGTRRGAHLALTLERLQEVAEAPLLRLGLSATQKPIEEVARYLVGCGDRKAATGVAALHIVDEGHRREMDLALELPRSPLEAVMSHEVWTEYYDRLTDLIAAHRTTLVFVNTRRMAERVARELTDRLGDAAVTAHHGSLSKENRLDAESRLKGGQIKALVATASLELGIDIGHVDLVCQLGSPHRIATFLQRVGRSGHTVSGLPKGRLFPVSRDDLIECAALLRSVERGELDRIVTHDAPLDVLAQQIVAETSCRDYAEDELFALVRRAWPYRELTRENFDAVVKMTADGFATRRGRRSALLHRDEVNGNVRGRRGARMLAITSGGAIPEVADYRVVLEPDDTFIGTVNEDFAIESMAGDIFQLGNMSWQILQVTAGTVRVADAKGAPPSIPFWLGEAPARSDELSKAVSDLRTEWSADVSDEASRIITEYLEESRKILGELPTQDTIILERFFDESGGMQLVLHAPFGSRINKAWGLALRKRFCRQFNFELQAAATEDAILLSLGPQHSFPLAGVFRYLHPATAREILVQAFLVAPVFQTRWRWNTTISLAVPRNRNGKKVPPQLQRMLADDLMAAVFPDAAACPENLPGDRELPDHPLVNQVVRDCLEEAMDFEGLTRVLTRIHAGEIRCLARDTPEPSPLAHEILNAKPYAFLDDAPLEERRTQAVQTRRAASGDPAAILDAAAIKRVREEERPDPRDADELHDALLSAGFLTSVECGDEVAAFLSTLRASHRADRVMSIWIPAERLPELQAIHNIQTTLVAPASRLRTWTRDEAILELIRSRMSLVGPTTAHALATPLAIEENEVNTALLTLEAEGAVLRGSFEGGEALEWCDRRLLARIHRYTLNRLRAEIEPVTASDFQRFLFKPLVGIRKQSPIRVKDAQKLSPAWNWSEEAAPDLAQYLIRFAKPHKLADAPGGKKHLTTDQAVLDRGKRAFAQNCARCHSSRRPPANVDPNSPEGRAWFEREVMKPDFLEGNFLSSEARVPITEVRTNATRAAARNGLRDHVWDNFSSDTYKELPPVGAIDVWDPITKSESKWTVSSPGRGYYRPPSLVSVWSAAPFLHNNAVGKHVHGISVEERMEAFNDGITKMLWPENRGGAAGNRDGVDGYSTSLWLTTQESSLKLPASYLDHKPLLRRLLSDHMQTDAFGGQYFAFGPIPRGTPVNLLANTDLELGGRNLKNLAQLAIHALKVMKDIEAEKLTGDAATQRWLESPVVKDLYKLNSCPDFIEDRGHYFGTDLPDADKRALIELLKTF